MGSRLTDTTTGAALWGFNDLSWYVRAWTTGSGLADLHLTDAERAGRYGRVQATGLLSVPAFARGLGGTVPYERLVKAVRTVVHHPEVQVVEFPYDWRLPVAHNAGLLAERMVTTLAEWRADPRHQQARREHPDGRAARIVIVAHSMGGLLARYLTRIPGVTDDVRDTITLGTPFYGSVKAITMINTGRGAPVPLPARRPLRYAWQERADEGVRRLAASLPGLHDLLPVYRCLNDGPTSRRPTHADLVDIGADPALAADGASLHEQLAGRSLPEHRCVVGTAQPTPQSFTITDGVVTAENRLLVDRLDGLRWEDAGGDGTVYRGAATLADASRRSHNYLPQQHGALACTDEASAYVRAVITEQDPDLLGPPMAAGDLGVDAPDLVLPNEEFAATITGITRPRQATCRVFDAGGGRQLDLAPIEARDGTLCAVITVPGPGMYRLEIGGSGYSPVERLLLAADPTLPVQDGTP
ncbi:esterase/lipase family protein [Actinoplanes derwentensis]|nr:hypothetical protein [Actinoplanes derwentensis]